MAGRQMVEEKSALCVTRCVGTRLCEWREALLGRAQVCVCVCRCTFMEDIGSRFPPFYDAADVGPIRMGKLIQSDELISATVSTQAKKI